MTTIKRHNKIHGNIYLNGRPRSDCPDDRYAIDDVDEWENASGTHTTVHIIGSDGCTQGHSIANIFRAIARGDIKVELEN